MSLFTRNRWSKLIDHCSAWTPPQCIRRVILFERESKAKVVVTLIGGEVSVSLAIPDRPRGEIHTMLDATARDLVEQMLHLHAARQRQRDNPPGAIDIGPIEFKVSADKAGGSK